MPHHPLSEDIFPNIPSKSVTVSFSSCPVTYYLGGETILHLATKLFQVVVEREEMPPEPPFLQTKHPQLLYIRFVL